MLITFPLSCEHVEWLNPNRNQLIQQLINLKNKLDLIFRRYCRGRPCACPDPSTAVAWAGTRLGNHKGLPLRPHHLCGLLYLYGIDIY